MAHLAFADLVSDKVSSRPASAERPVIITHIENEPKYNHTHVLKPRSGTGGGVYLTVKRGHS